MGVSIGFLVADGSTIVVCVVALGMLVRWLEVGVSVGFIVCVFAFVGRTVEVASTAVVTGRWERQAAKNPANKPRPITSQDKTFIFISTLSRAISANVIF